MHTASIMLRSFVGKIKKGYFSLLFVHKRLATGGVPDDVMEGYFAVLAIKGGETKRFVVELDSLTDPAFLVLLDQAHQEYGFGQKGALSVPCRPQELQKILNDWKA